MKTKKILNEQHAGFAVTLEVMCTLVMMFMFIFMIIFFMMVMNVQRFMNTVLTTTAAEASRWGGTETRAYQINVGGTNLIDSAQQMLDNVINYDSNGNPTGFFATISGTPNKISHDGDEVLITINYHLPSPWKTLGIVSSNSQSTDVYSRMEGTSGMEMSIRVKCIMKSGGLLQ